MFLRWLLAVIVNFSVDVTSPAARAWEGVSGVVQCVLASPHPLLPSPRITPVSSLDLEKKQVCSIARCSEDALVAGWALGVGLCLTFRCPCSTGDLASFCLSLPSSRTGLQADGSLIRILPVIFRWKHLLTQRCLSVCLPSSEHPCMKQVLSIKWQGFGFFLFFF